MCRARPGNEWWSFLQWLFNKKNHEGSRTVFTVGGDAEMIFLQQEGEDKQALSFQHRTEPGSDVPVYMIYWYAGGYPFKRVPFKCGIIETPSHSRYLNGYEIVVLGMTTWCDAELDDSGRCWRGRTLTGGKTGSAVLPIEGHGEFYYK